MFETLKRLANQLKTRAQFIAAMPLRDPSVSTLFGYIDAASGVAVTEWTALTYSTFWLGVNILAEALTVPCNLVERGSKGKKILYDHPAHRLVNDSPNKEMTCATARYALGAHSVSWGNSYAEIERNGAGHPIAIWPLTPNRITPDRKKSNDIYYILRQANGRTVNIPARDMLHVPGANFDGIMGYSIVTMARETVGLALAAERCAATFYGSGTTPSGVIETDEKLKDTGVMNLRDSWQLMHQGVDRMHRIAILHSGAKYKPIFLPPEVSQFLQSRRFQTIEMARWFNIPPHMLMDLERATFSNIEQQSLEFVTRTMYIWYNRFAEEYRRKLLTEKEQRTMYFKHDYSHFLRGDMQTRYTSLGNALQHGWLNIDEVRDMEDLNAVPDGKGQIYTLPVNQVPVDMVAKGQHLKTPQAQGDAGPLPPTHNPTGADNALVRSLRSRGEDVALKYLNMMPSAGKGKRYVIWPVEMKPPFTMTAEWLAGVKWDTQKVKIMDLVATQDTVDDDKVKAFIKDTRAPNTWQDSLVKGLPNDHPYIVEKDDVCYIVDGHNRLTGRYLLGKEKAKVYYTRI